MKQPINKIQLVQILNRLFVNIKTIFFLLQGVGFLNHCSPSRMKGRMPIDPIGLGEYKN